MACCPKCGKMRVGKNKIKRASCPRCGPIGRDYWLEKDSLYNALEIAYNANIVSLERT